MREKHSVSGQIGKETSQGSQKSLLSWAKRRKPKCKSQFSSTITNLILDEVQERRSLLKTFITNKTLLTEETQSEFQKPKYLLCLMDQW